MDAQAPQSNPQTEIGSILSGTPSPVSVTPPVSPKKTGKGRIWLIVLALFVVLGVVVYALLNSSPKNTGISTEEKMQILNYLEAESQPVAIPIEEKASIVEKLQERGSTTQ